MCLEVLKENFEFVENNKDKLLKKYLNKYLLVWQKKVVGSFDTYEKAAGEGLKNTVSMRTSWCTPYWKQNR